MNRREMMLDSTEMPIAFESLYKYWQRLSDYLLHFFPDALFQCHGKSYFQTPLNYIKNNHPELCQSENFNWIVNFLENSYHEFNRRRKFFVHTAGYDNQFFQEYLKSHEKEEAMEAMDQERTYLLQFLKEHLELCLEGYLKVMAFLNEIEFSATEQNNNMPIFKYKLIKP